MAILAADILDPEYPIEWVEQELRDAGFDPDKIAKDSMEIVRKTLAEHRKDEDAS